jgi:hypothetical protein
MLDAFKFPFILLILLYIISLVLSAFIRRYNQFLAPLIYSLLLSNYYMYQYSNSKIEHWLSYSIGDNLFQLGEEWMESIIAIL